MATEPSLVLAFDSPYTPLSTYMTDASGASRYRITGRGSGNRTRTVVTRADKEIASLEWHSFGSDKIYLNESTYPTPVDKFYNKKSFVDERSGERYVWKRIGKGPGINFEVCECIAQFSTTQLNTWDSYIKSMPVVKK